MSCIRATNESSTHSMNDRDASVVRVAGAGPRPLVLWCDAGQPAKSSLSCFQACTGPLRQSRSSAPLLAYCAALATVRISAARDDIDEKTAEPRMCLTPTGTALVQRYVALFTGTAMAPLQCTEAEINPRKFIV